jgi:hypothetical protein
MPENSQDKPKSPAREKPSDGELISGWLRSHPSVMISLATFLYVAFQVYKAADFEVNTMLEILQSDGLTSILIGVLLVQLPAELVILASVACWWFVFADPEPVAGRGWRRPVASAQISPAVSLAALAVLAFWIIPWPFVLVSGFLILIAIAPYWAVRRAHSLRGVTALSRFIPAALGTAALLYAISGPVIWAPSESLTTSDNGRIVGYVIAGEGQWTTILTPTWTGYHHSGNTVRLESSDKIKSKELCAIAIAQPKLFGLKLYRPIQLWHALVKGRSTIPGALTPRCPQPGPPQ